MNIQHIFCLYKDADNRFLIQKEGIFSSDLLWFQPKSRGGDGEEGAEEEGEGEEVVYKYIPPVSKEWVSQGSEREIEEESLIEHRPRVSEMPLYMYQLWLHYDCLKWNGKYCKYRLKAWWIKDIWLSVLHRNMTLSVPNVHSSKVSKERLKICAY